MRETRSLTEQQAFELKFLEKLVSENRDYIDAMIPLADLYTKCGMYEKGLELDLQLVKLLPEDDTAFYNLACSYSLLGEKDKAFEALREAIHRGYKDLAHLERDPDLKLLREDLRFKDLLEEVRKYSKQD